MRGLIARAVRLAEVLAPAIGALDLAGVSWRQLRAFARGAGCLADCRDGHTYGPWCQLGFPLPGPTYLLHALAEATMPLPEAPQRLHEETIRAIHEALTQVALAEERPAGCQARECFGIECMTECASTHRLERYLAASVAEQTEQAVDTVVEEIEVEPAELHRIAEHLASHPLVESVHLVHHPACASLPDVEGKAGPCDCGASTEDGDWSGL